MNKKRPRMHRPAAVSDLLGAFLRGTPAEKRLSEGRIWVVWDEAVGARIAVHAQPCAFREGTLTVTVDSAPWMQQLSYLKKDLIAKVNGALEEELVTDIFMKAGRIAPRTAAKPKAVKQRALSEEEIALVTEQAALVQDPELRAIFENLIKKDRQNR